jgi:dihydrofolate reductase
MRKVIFAINTSLDGCCSHTIGNPDDELLGFFTRLVQDADVFAYGRKTYELMVPYWPDVAKNPLNETKADTDFARAFNAVGKIVVFSGSLEKVERENTTIVRSNIGDTILKLKQEEGKNIMIGGVDIPSQLMALGLVDEFYFVVHPVLVGTGPRLFDGTSLPGRLGLKLVESTVFRSGCVALHYVKDNGVNSTL